MATINAILSSSEVNTDRVMIAIQISAVSRHGRVSVTETLIQQGAALSARE